MLSTRVFTLSSSRPRWLLQNRATLQSIIARSSTIALSPKPPPESSDVKKSNGKGLQTLLNAACPEASFDSQARHPPSHCHPSTRIGLLDHIFRWVDDGDEDILFLDGPAGAGKSAIAQTVAASCAEKKTLVASYFFFRGSQSRNTIAPLVPTLAYQIAAPSRAKRNTVKRVLKNDPSVLDKSPGVQLRKFVLKLYQPSMFRWEIFTKRKRRLLIIDGLDECNGENDQRQIVDLLGQLVNDEHCTIRCLIASRPEPHIISAIGLLTCSTKVARITLNEQSWDATGDIRMYLRSHFDEIASRIPPSVPRPWPSDDIIEMLVQKAGGIFVYVSTVLKYIGDQDSLPTIQLEHVLKLSPGTTPFAELDHLYQQILMACPSQHLTALLHIFGFVFLHNPDFKEEFNVSLIETLLGLSPGEVAMTLRKMHSIISIRTTGSKSTISFLHASFGDFIFTEERSGRFFINSQRESLFLAKKCIDYMSHREAWGLKRTIIYAWNSWLYHGVEAGDSYLVEFLKMLYHYDKHLWAETLPDSYHHYCTDGLDAGITWLQHRSADFPIDDLISNLTLVRQELERKHSITIPRPRKPGPGRKPTVV